MSSRKEEIKVKDELKKEGLALPPTGKTQKGKGGKGPPMQPICQSVQLQKPSTTIQRIQAGCYTAAGVFFSCDIKHPLGP